MTMTGAPLSVLYTAVTGVTENSGYFSIQQNGDFNYDTASLTYASGTVAASLGLTQASGAWLQTPGENITSEAAFMSLIEAEDPDFGSFQSTMAAVGGGGPGSADRPGEVGSVYRRSVSISERYEHHTAGWHEYTDDRSGRHVQRPRCQRAHAGRVGQLYSDHRSDVRRSGDCRPCRLLQLDGRERANTCAARLLCPDCRRQ
jgi:hypothetical protein